MEIQGALQMKFIIAISLLTLSLTSQANSVSLTCPYAKDKVSASIDDTYAHSGETIRVHYTADIELHYVYNSINTIQIERNRYLNNSREITKDIRSIFNPADRIIIHENSTLYYGILNPGTYLIAYRIYIPARDCDLVANATLIVN